MDYYLSIKRKDILISFYSSPLLQNPVNGVTLINSELNLCSQLAILKIAMAVLVWCASVVEKFIACGVSSKIWCLSPNGRNRKKILRLTELHMPDQNPQERRRQKTKQTRVKK